MYLLPPEDPYRAPCADESFDVTVCSDVIEHVQRPGKLVAELARLTRPGGRCIITTPYRLQEEPNNPMHVREFYPSELTALMAGLFSGVQIRLYQELTWCGIYSLSIRSKPVMRWAINVANRVTRWNPFMVNETTKKKWDIFSLIVAVGTK